MILAKRISERDVKRYYESPLLVLSEWASEYDIVTVEDRHVLLKKDMFHLINDSKLKSEGRLPNAETCYPVCRWPMYLDGYKHRETRALYDSYISKIKSYLSQDLCVKKSYDISRYSLIKKIFEIYSKAICFDNDLLLNNYELIESMHFSFLKRNEYEGLHKWDELSDKVTMDMDELSVITFMLADTIPSIIHTYYSVIRMCLNTRSRIENIGPHDVIAALVDNPPFYNLVRVAGERLIIHNEHEVNMNDKVVFPIRYWALSESDNRKKISFVFGSGNHACPGRGVVFPMVLCLLKSLSPARTNKHEFRIRDDGNVCFIEDSNCLSPE